MKKSKMVELLFEKMKSTICFETGICESDAEDLLSYLEELGMCPPTYYVHCGHLGGEIRKWEAE